MLRAVVYSLTVYAALSALTLSFGVFLVPLPFLRSSLHDLGAYLVHLYTDEYPDRELLRELISGASLSLTLAVLGIVLGGWIASKLNFKLEKAVAVGGAFVYLSMNIGPFIAHGSYALSFDFSSYVLGAIPTSLLISIAYYVALEGK